MSTEDLEKSNSGEELTEVEGELVSGEGCDLPEAESELPADASELPAESRRQERKRRLASGAVALVTSASVLVGGIFNSPALMPDDENPVPQIVYTENDDDDLDGSGDDGDDGGTEQTGESAAAAAEQEAPPEVWDDERRKLRVPLAVRLLAIPVAGLLCWLVVTGATALLGPVLGPIVGNILSWALLLAALLGGFAAAVKAVFPDLPLKKILNKRSITGVLIGGAALAAADIVLPLFWAEYTRVEAIVRALGILAVIGTASGSFTLRELRRRRAEAEAAAEEPPEEEEPEEEEAEKPMTREDILALADTVSRKR